MSYRFARTDDSIQDGLQRIALEQIGHVLHVLDDPVLDPDTKVHAVRQRCKKLRALLRIVQPVFAAYDHEHAAFRGIARALAGWRDASVRIESYDAVMQAFAGHVDRRALAPIRRRLTLQRRALLAETDLDAALDACRRDFERAARRVPSWRLRRDGFAALEDGLHATYRRARKAMARAQEDPTPEHLHAWRRHCQHHGHHVRLLQPIHSGAMAARIKAFQRLGEQLGQYHDLAVLESTLSADPASYGRPGNVGILLDLLDTHRKKLAAHAFADGSRLLSETPSVLVERWREQYAAWHPEHLPPLALRTGS